MDNETKRIYICKLCKEYILNVPQDHPDVQTPEIGSDFGENNKYLTIRPNAITVNNNFA